MKTLLIRESVKLSKADTEFLIVEAVDNHCHTIESTETGPSQLKVGLLTSVPKGTDIKRQYIMLIFFFKTNVVAHI